MSKNYSVTLDDLKYQAVPLPEDIQKLKWSGRFHEARSAIALRLGQSGLPAAQKQRLLLELKTLDHLEARYSLSLDGVLKQIRSQIPGFTAEELDQLILEGRLEWIFLEGSRRFLPNTVRNLFQVSPDLWPRMKDGDPRDFSHLDETFRGLKTGQYMQAHIHMRHDLHLTPEAWQEGKTLRVHLPLPLQRQQIHNLQIRSIHPCPAHLPEDGDIQPAVYFEGCYGQEQVFSAEYEFDNITPYINLAEIPPETVMQALVQDGYPEDACRYLSEQAPHILFTPYLKALVQELSGSETNPLLLARRFYDYITVQLRYTYVRDYASMDSIAELMAINGKGDCGMQGILFITLCRIAGIPARWQSGLAAAPGSIGEHDWAEFYLPSVGWVYADPSFGMYAKLRGHEDRWNFYFGSIDPYRVPLNCGMQAELNPPKAFLRKDPVDNQGGEAEYTDGGLYTGVSYDYTDLGIHLLPPTSRHPSQEVTPYDGTK